MNPFRTYYQMISPTSFDPHPYVLTLEVLLEFSPDTERLFAHTGSRFRENTIQVPQPLREHANQYKRHRLNSLEDSVYKVAGTVS